MEMQIASGCSHMGRSRTLLPRLVILKPIHVYNLEDLSRKISKIVPQATGLNLVSNR